MKKKGGGGWILEKNKTDLIGPFIYWLTESIGAVTELL